MNSNEKAVAAEFEPSSGYRIACGTRTQTRNLITLGVLNGLIVALSHLLFSLYLFLGPGAIVMSFFHQCTENLFIAGLYLLLAIKAPHNLPFTSNAVIWSFMGLAQGWWPIVPVAIPAGLLADQVVRYAVPAGRQYLLLACFAVYATLLSVATNWPYLLLKNSEMIQRLQVMSPGIADMAETMTLPFFALQVSAVFTTAVIGGWLALRIINRHFAPLGWQVHHEAHAETAR